MSSALRRIGKVVVALAVIAVAFLLLVINYGAAESRMSCPGQVSRTADRAAPVTTPATLYARVEAYRWFVFWADHDAMIYWEIQPGGDTGFGYYSESSFGTPITDLTRTKTHGSWSSLSRRIHVETSLDRNEAFVGICK